MHPIIIPPQLKIDLHSEGAKYIYCDIKLHLKIAQTCWLDPFGQ